MHRRLQLHSYRAGAQRHAAAWRRARRAWAGEASRGSALTVHSSDALSIRQLTPLMGTRPCSFYSPSTEETIMPKTVQIARLLVAAAVLGGVAMPAWAVDGVILIDQNKAMAGSVTPGDAPGFPVTISLPGSYRLAGDLTVPDANTDAILITANNVTLDLNGFAILGPTACNRSGSGGDGAVVCAPTGNGNGVNGTQASNITVVNGTIRGMGHTGILLLGGTQVPPHKVEKMSV